MQNYYKKHYKNLKNSEKGMKPPLNSPIFEILNIFNCWLNFQFSWKYLQFFFLFVGVSRSMLIVIVIICYVRVNISTTSLIMIVLNNLTCAKHKEFFQNLISTTLQFTSVFRNLSFLWAFSQNTKICNKKWEANLGSVLLNVTNCARHKHDNLKYKIETNLCVKKFEKLNGNFIMIKDSS